MRRNEVELIAALVEGRLEDETEARALVESSDAHRAEFEAQKLAFEALSTLPAVELTETERAALRRDVWTELQARPAAAPAKAPWWLRWSYAAAGVFVVVGLLVVVDQTNPNFTPTAFLGGEDDAAFESIEETIGRSQGATDLTEAPAVTDAAGADAPAFSDADDGASEFAAPAETLSLLADQVRQATTESAADFGLTYYTSVERAEQTTCLDIAELSEHEVIGLLTEIADTYLIVVPAGEEIGPATPIWFVDPDTCEVVFTDG